MHVVLTSFRTIAAFAIGAGVAALLVGLAFSSADPRRQPPLELHKDGVLYYGFSVGTTEFLMPAAYFNKVPVIPGRANQSILFHGRGAEFEPITAPTRNRNPLDAIVLLEDENKTTSLPTRWGVDRRLYGPLTSMGDVFGLHKFVSDKGSAGKPLRNQMVWSNGAIVAEPRSDQSASARAELFLEGTDVEPHSYLDCDGDMAGLAPQCSLIFSDRGLLYDVGFDKRQLERWRNYKNRLMEIMHSFEVVPQHN